MRRLTWFFLFIIYPGFLLGVSGPLLAQIADVIHIADNQIVENFSRDMEVLIILYKLEEAVDNESEEMGDLLDDLITACPECGRSGDVVTDPGNYPP